jgi:phage-related protein
MMEKIHPGALADLEKFCNAIRTHSYLAMPKGSLGSIGRIVAGINGVVAAFQSIINDIYNGIILYIQQVYAWVNGIIGELQKKLMQAIEDIIPLDLICLLLDTFQTILDDVNFFTSLDIPPFLVSSTSSARALSSEET